MARSIYTEQEAQFLKNIGYRVQFFRKKAGLSQEELAERCGMSYSTISHCCFANKLRKIFIQSAKKKRRLKGF